MASGAAVAVPPPFALAKDALPPLPEPEAPLVPELAALPPALELG